jgi:hypothetical protein
VVEKAFEVLCHCLPDFLDRGACARFLVEGGDGHAIDPTGSDVGEAREALFRDVKGEAVHGDPFAHADSKGGDFSVVDPDPGQAIPASCADPKIGEGEDEGFFQGPEIGVEVLPVIFEIENGVADELTRAVIGRLPPAIDFYNRMRKGGGIAEGGLIANAPDGVDRGMLEKEQGVTDLTRASGGGEFLLACKSVLIRDRGSKPANVHERRGR